MYGSMYNQLCFGTFSEEISQGESESQNGFNKEDHPHPAFARLVFSCSFLFFFVVFFC